MEERAAAGVGASAGPAGGAEVGGEGWGGKGAGKGREGKGRGRTSVLLYFSGPRITVSLGLSFVS